MRQKRKDLEDRIEHLRADLRATARLLRKGRYERDFLAMSIEASLMLDERRANGERPCTFTGDRMRTEDTPRPLSRVLRDAAQAPKKERRRG